MAATCALCAFLLLWLISTPVVQPLEKLTPPAAKPVTATPSPKAPSAPKMPKAGDIWKEPQTGMEFLYIQAGAFTMGSPASEDARDDDERQHEVAVDGYWMSKYEVTVDQFSMFAIATGYHTDAEKEGWAPGFYDDNWTHH